MKRRARSLLFITLCAALWGAVSPAFADGADPAALREADRHFQAGVAFYAEKNFKAALVEFKRAYDVAPNPVVLYNVGQTDYQLQSYAASLQAFERYMKEGNPTGARRIEVTATMETLRKRVGYLDVTSNLPESDVTIDDELAGKTPLSAPVMVSVGQHKVTVSHAEYPSASRVVEIAAGDRQSVSLELSKQAPPVVKIVRQAPPEEPEDPSSSNVTERPGKTYYFIGARYRGTVLPKFMLNLFVDEGKTIYTNTAGIELDIRRDGLSVVPALSFVEYGTGDMLFLQKNKDPVQAANWSNVNSTLKAFYGTVDLLWSTQLTRHVAVEYGAGFGLGVLFGDLETSWVYERADGPYTASDGRRFAPCIAETDARSCERAGHQNTTIAKVNHYIESSWAAGGSRPIVFPHIAIPMVGVRVKPVRELEARLGCGFSLTGFFFGLSANYGLSRPAPAAAPAPEH